MLVYRLCKCAFNWPIIFSQSLLNVACGNTCYFSPLCNAMGFSLERDKFITPSVSRLLLMSGPSAILRGVTFVVVNSVKRFSMWFFPHVGKEINKGATPFVTDDNTSLSVRWVIIVARAMASANHFIPNIIGRRTPHSMITRTRSLRVLALAATRFRVASSQRMTNYISRVAANTLTQPRSNGMFIKSSIFNDRPSIKGLPGHIFNAVRQCFNSHLCEASYA